MLRNNNDIETMTAEEVKAAYKEEKRLRKLNNEHGPFFALLMPVIILGCIYGGITTTTEAAAIATAYAIPVGFFIYKKLTYTELKNSFIDAAKATGTIMLLTLTVQMLSRMFIDVNLPKLILNAFYSVTDNRWGIMLMINLFMIVLGMLMDDTSGCSPRLSLFQSSKSSASAPCILRRSLPLTSAWATSRPLWRRCSISPPALSTHLSKRCSSPP